MDGYNGARPASSCFILFLHFQFNLGVTPDSVFYIEGARNILAGKGFVNNNGVFINSWPPLYPALLAAAARIFHRDVMDVAIIINSVFISLQFFLFNLLLKKFNARFITLIVANLVLLFSPALRVFSMFWSEPPFIVLLLLMLYILASELKHHTTLKLIVLGITGGLLFLARFAAFPFLLLFGGYIFFSQGLNIRERFTRVLYYSVPIAAIFISWFIYQSSFGAKLARTEISVHWPALLNFEVLIQTFANWISPYQTVYTLIIIVIAVLLIYSLGIRKAFQFLRSLLKNNLLVGISILGIILYILFLLFIIAFVDARVPLNNRLLAVIYPLCIIGLFPFINKLFTPPLYAEKMGLMLLLAILVIGHVNREYGYWKNMSRYGSGLTGLDWRISPLMNALKNYEGYKIYTNCDEVISFYMQKPMELECLPQTYSRESKIINPGFSKEMIEVKSLLENGSSIIVYFNKYDYRINYPSKSQLYAYFHGMKIVPFPDGFIIKR